MSNSNNSENIVKFQCNICGNYNSCLFKTLNREEPTCKICGSTVRMRSIIHILSIELFGKSIPLWKFPKNKQISGLGMSDWEIYAHTLSAQLDYYNTYYHQEPKFDITSIPLTFEKKFDFIISSDVFEHIAPPVSIAFFNLKRILKEHGFVIFTVPYTNENENTLEHFPDLYDYKLKEIKGVKFMENITKEGIYQNFHNLIYHGGNGFTVEMRLFSRKSLENEFSFAGFSDVTFYSEPYLEYGIIWKELWSLPIVARLKKPILKGHIIDTINYDSVQNQKNLEKLPLVSIIIVNWNGLQYLRECLDSLLFQSYQNFELILVDNASKDKSVEFVESEYPSVTIIKNNENLGFAAGTNIGIYHSKGEIIALFNQDAMADKEWLSILVQELINNDDIAAVAGKVYYRSDKYPIGSIFSTWSKIDPYSAKPSNFFRDEYKAEVDYLTGCAMLVKRDVINKIGPLDTDYFLYFEETDWCARMIRAGYRLLYIPDAIVWHVVSGSIENSQLKTWYMMRNRVRFALKNFDIGYLPLFIISLGVEVLSSIRKELMHHNQTSLIVTLKAIQWNVKNISKTLKARKRDLTHNSQ